MDLLFGKILTLSSTPEAIFHGEKSIGKLTQGRLTASKEIEKEIPIVLYLSAAEVIFLLFLAKCMQNCFIIAF